MAARKKLDLSAFQALDLSALQIRDEERVNAVLRRIRLIHAVGKQLLDSERGVIPQLVRDSEKQGGRPLSQYLLFKAKQFAARYSASDLRELCKLRRPSSVRSAEELPLSWGHVVHLLSIADHDQRTEIQKKAAAEDWSSEELAERIKELKVETEAEDEVKVEALGNRRKGSGRKPQSLGGIRRRCKDLARQIDMADELLAPAIWKEKLRQEKKEDVQNEIKETIAATVALKSRMTVLETKLGGLRGMIRRWMPPGRAERRDVDS